VIIGLVFIPGRGRQSSRDDVLRYFETTDGHALGLRLLRDAVDNRDEIDVDAALIVCGTFGITADHLDLLVQLASAEWHHKHEDVATALDHLRVPAAVDALYHLAWWIPDYLDWDDTRGLARKAIWALGKTPGPEAEGVLKLLLDEPDQIVRENAAQQLARRNQS
jgi:hypothetical protein